MRAAYPRSVARHVVAREGIAGRHAVKQALASSREVHSLLLDKDLVLDDEAKAMVARANERGVRVSYVTKLELGRLIGTTSQGVGAIVGPLGNFSVKDLVENARKAGHEPFLVAVDGVEDPQNLGAMARSAYLAGCDGLIVPERGTATIGHGAQKAASGAFAQLPVAQVASLRTALETLRREGVWIVGADANGGKAPWKLKLSGAVCFVMGSESQGLSKSTLEALDQKVCIPTPGGDLSLNVSTATAILVFERVRQTSA